MNRANKITEGALLTSVYIILLLIVLFVPFVFLFGLFILPIPFILFTSRHGYQAGLILFMLALGLSVFFAAAISFPITVLTGIGGLVVGHLMFKQRSPYETWALGTVGFVLATVTVIALLQFLFNINIYNELHNIIDESILMTESVLNQIGLGPQGEEQIKLIEEQMRTYPDLLPAMITILSVCLAFFSQWLSYKILNRTRNERYFFPPFKQFNLPKTVLWLYLITLLSSFFIQDSSSTISIGILNIITLLMMLIIIQGFSFVFFYADHKQWPKALPIFVVIITFIIPFLFMLFIRIVGIIDLGFDLKERVAVAGKK